MYLSRIKKSSERHQVVVNPSEVHILTQINQKTCAIYRNVTHFRRFFFLHENI
jgi:hypothetical protein